MPGSENNQRYTLTLVNVALIVIGLMAIMYLMTRPPSTENQAMIALFASVIGALVNQHSNSQQWWFGTTKGTSDTTAVIRDLAASTLPPAGALQTTTTTVTTDPPPAEPKIDG